MFVSILQLMGLPFGKPIQSRPGPEPLSGASDKPSMQDNKGINRSDGHPAAPDQGLPAGAHPPSALAGPSRRQEVKAQTVKPAAKAKAKASAPADTRKKEAAPASPPPSKPAVQTRSIAKNTASATSGSPAKRAPVKVPATDKAPAKAVAKVVAKASKPATAEVPAKPTAAPIKAAGKSRPEAASPLPVAPVAKAASQPEARPAPVAAPKAAAAPTAPVRSGRPSRLSQITVPSMAQSVASTAAKASYTNTMSSPVLTPPTFIPAKKDPKLANNWKSKPADQLTDAEVLAMPDDEYMNDKQMAFFRAKLLQLKQGILSNAGETTEHLRADTVIVPDPADRATIEEEHALELRTRDRERKLLKKIEQSIARIDAGDYGYCDETGEPIGVGRLLARPTATLSLEAQQRRELKQKMFGD